MEKKKIFKIRPKKILSQEKRQELLNFYHANRNKKLDRIQTIILYDAGYTHEHLADIMQVSEQTIRRHLSEYQKQKKLAPCSGGSESYLTKIQSGQLVKHLKDNTYLYVKEIVAYVATAFKVKYSISGMRHWLYHNNFRYKKPHGVPAKADKEKQEAFIATYEKLKATVKDAKESIYFLDSVHPQHQTRLSYGWILKGERKAIPMTARQYRVNIIGGISLSDYKFIYHEAEKVNTNSIKEYLEKLRSHHPKENTVHIIWDNAGYHRGQEIRDYAKENKIELYYLPPYSPNLNPIERLWKRMHEKVTRNKYYEKFAIFKEKLIEYLEQVRKGEEIEKLKKSITDKFEVLHSPLIPSNIGA